MLRIGCSGWNYQSWRNDFYPPRTPASRWLEHYATVFDTVEVNSTFYRLAKRDAVARWVEQTPDGFAFAVKASRYLTHMKRLRDLEPGLARFLERIEPLIEHRRLGPILWQLPPRFPRDDDRLAAALQLLDEQLPGRHAFEFRDPSWFASPVLALLRAHDAALVIADDARSNLAVAEGGSDCWRYVRLHYGARGRNGNYSLRELSAWAERISDWRRRGDVFVYCNNDWQGFAPNNASTLRQTL